jgi:putative ABC transport system ATP-binding protein
MLTIEKLNLTFHPGAATENHALKDVTLQLNPGDYVTLIGGNGAGKSTLLSSVAGTFMPDTGKITINGTDVTNLSEHRRAIYLGRVFQDPMRGTVANMNIEENLALAYRRGTRRKLKWYITSWERKLYKERLATLELGLENRLADKAGLLSGGQRQALTLLMATLKEPKLLLLDEHTAALDPKTAPKVLETGEKIISKHKLTTMMVTHNMRDAIHYGNRLIMMSGGRIILDIKGVEKQKLTVDGLIAKFSQASGEEFSDDRALLG